MLVKLCSQKSSHLQMMMGLHPHASGYPKRMLNLLAVSSLSVSHMTVCTAFRSGVLFRRSTPKFGSAHDTCCMITSIRLIGNMTSARYHSVAFDRCTSAHSTIYGCSVQTPSIEPLEVKETKTYPLPALKIDQSTISGNIEILETIMRDTLQLPEEWLTDYTNIIVAGDQLTISRIASLQELHREDRTSFHRMQ
ncbi:hypothetical protein BCR41DRAFT_416367 [Lobosporangium transversale]|uniref:DUF6589 domain-containing protein n=1 Tax=Lobosporangium transversale TaxID=64571 RepID=A0A1Y2G5N2_9FUNG|nr:hypothetical protein BCR41DRAFT_416367 [Lobosporangium transversale]ORY95970.1 hypothetical protein BCR41DRAFT_416367 [Lobosporangium transversale]|eukprot:XP_021875411.1 hypothetical protein BCR41DRAFT_416367 [Lobosporangium transversale]